ncbi:MAG TPA: helix-hairpin-helix domain-containing protein [Burkholderiaceae bacterium]|nr:helix-hairpin-helix domain-containing protein [Burkholderiaceae bacterium]HMX11359.1 helix-hairpin-helix domain-containing protein [Burkholderiaceae bacterium]HMZ01000.1 helix-hairpin-helix domain-containing protein [Burkholderiaceae bacterium]HNB43499.1 helix-hairpin-helix domain-containing protein [Burkholderiaceae bacterium]HNG79753.1 helix-hairpin-helix domain-containing protein [Burkholderiaceae bacterium]
MTRAPAAPEAAGDAIPIEAPEAIDPVEEKGMRVRHRAVVKAARAEDCRDLEQIPNIGAAMARELRAIGLQRPSDLIGQDAHALYLRLCEGSGRRHDPCVLDTCLAVVDFMGGAAARPWWQYTEVRKAHPATPPALARFSGAAPGRNTGHRR